jgi:hypothetical protein
MKQHNIHSSTPEALPSQLADASLMERSVWMLSENEGFSLSEIAEITGLTEAEAQKILASAVQKVPTPSLGWHIQYRWALRSMAAAFIGLLCWMVWNKQTTPSPAMEQAIAPKNIQTTEKQTPVYSPEPTPEAVISQAPTLSKTPAFKSSTGNKTPDLPNGIISEPPMFESNHTIAEIVKLSPSPSSTESIIPPITAVEEPIALLPISVQPSHSLYQNKTVALPILTSPIAHNALAQEPVLNTAQRLRLALTPRSFVDADEKLSISLQLPSILLPGKSTN